MLKHAIICKNNLIAQVSQHLSVRRDAHTSISLLTSICFLCCVDCSSPDQLRKKQSNQELSKGSECFSPKNSSYTCKPVSELFMYLGLTGTI